MQTSLHTFDLHSILKNVLKRSRSLKLALLQDTSQEKRTQVQAHITELLEAFGNAQTTIHANSSRFAKYHEIIFDEESEKILGCTIFYFPTFPLY